MKLLMGMARSHRCDEQSTQRPDAFSKHLLWGQLDRFVKAQRCGFCGKRSMQGNIVPLEEVVARQHQADPYEPDRYQECADAIGEPHRFQSDGKSVQARL